MGECFFWYRPTRVVPDQRPLNGHCCYPIDLTRCIMFSGCPFVRMCIVLHYFQTACRQFLHVVCIYTGAHPVEKCDIFTLHSRLMGLAVWMQTRQKASSEKEEDSDGDSSVCEELVEEPVKEDSTSKEQTTNEDRCVIIRSCIIS